MATPKTLTLTDDRTQKAYELYGQAKVDNAIAKQAGVGQVVKAPSIGTPQRIVRNTDGSTTTTNGGTTGTTGAVAGSAASVLGDLTADDPYYSQYGNAALSDANMVVDEEAIKANKLKEYQAQLDALQTVQNDELNKYRIQAQQRSGQASIIQGARGLAGSNVGTAMDNTVTQSNNEIEAAVLAQQALARQAIYGEVRKGAQEEIANKLAAKKAGGEAYLTYIKGESERKSTRNKEVAKRLISSKSDPSQLTDADWKDLESKGYSKQDILAEYQDMKAQTDAAQSTAQAASDKAKLENSKVQAEIDKINADIEKGQMDAMKYYEVGNKIYARNEDGTSRFIGNAEFNPYTGAMQVTAGNSVYDPAKGTFTQAPVPGATTGDLRQYASQYPNEASLKNNNPAGITFSQGFADRLTQAGIQFQKGTNRPANEGGSYFGFPTIEEGMKAYDLLWSSPSYTGLTLNQALNRWNTGSTERGYGTQISGEVGVNGNTRVSDLSPDQLRAVQMAQLKRESPGMYKVLNSGGGGSGVSSQAQDIIKQINQNGGKPQDYILGTGADSQKLLQEVITGLNNQGGTGTLATDTRTQSLQLATDTINNLLDNKAFSGSFRARNDWTNVLGANDVTDFKNRVDALAGQLIQIDGPTLKAIFGPQISNADIDMIKKTILQGLDPVNQTPEAFEKTLNDVKAKMQAYISRLPNSTGTQTSTGTAPAAGQTSSGASFTVTYN